MKIFTIIAILIIASFGLNAQSPLVITKQNFLVSNSTAYSGLIAEEYLSSVAKPAFGANKSWNYSSMNTNGQFLISNSIGTPSEPFFSNANFVVEENFGVIAGDRGYYFDEYFTWNDDAYQAIGFGVKGQSYFIGDLTGSLTDSIIFPAQNQMYENPRSIIKFPYTFGSVTKSEFSKNLDFTISITPFGITDGQAKKVSHFTQIDSVVGWGSLVVPHVKDGAGASIPYDVLLVIRKTTVLDSLYLYGQPAPAPLLTAFGLVQGYVTTSNRLMFWRANHRILLLSMDLDESMSSITSANYDLDTDISTSINISDDSNSELTIFPNPVQKSLNIKLAENMTGIYNLTISDIYGNELTNSRFVNNNFSFELQNRMTNGTYFVRVSDENGRIVSNGKFIVNR